MVTELTPVTITRDTAAMALTAIGVGGIKFKNTGKEILLVSRAVAATSTITIATGGTQDGLAIADRTVAMAAGDSTIQEKLLGPFPTNIYNGSEGYITVTSTDTTNDKAAVFTFNATT